MNELTMEERAKAFGLYAPCKMAECNKDGSLFVGDNGNWCIENCTLTYAHYVGKGTAWPYKLILTPLEEISEQDMISVFNIEHPKSNASDWAKIDSVKMWIEQMSISYDVADFLRSRSYHLPYKNINLYEAGIAVKPNKTNSNE